MKTLYERVVETLQEFIVHQENNPHDLATALLFAVRRHQGHGECKTVIGVAEILDIV